MQERLDFSCALFGPDGGLVANAPHIPVHLGAMQETVQYQVGRLLFFARAQECSVFVLAKSWQKHAHTQAANAGTCMYAGRVT